MKKMQCDVSSPHYMHKWRDGVKSRWCGGVPWAINRASLVTTWAHVKVDWVISATGISKLIHGASGGRGDADDYVRWYPPEHEWGFGNLPPELHVKLMCKYPSWLKNPKLLSDEEFITLMLTSDITGIRLCSRCEPYWSDEMYATVKAIRSQ